MYIDFVAEIIIIALVMGIHKLNVNGAMNQKTKSNQKLFLVNYNIIPLYELKYIV